VFAVSTVLSSYESLLQSETNKFKMSKKANLVGFVVETMPSTGTKDIKKTVKYRYIWQEVGLTGPRNLMQQVQKVV
jgi:hypothetical protein